ncbi:protein Star-like [Neocloeon triangulifer]|uniref:protein Star-like n=1 Tax=Neocloeon triangulifer TaxID=2078957 RepID=UPI00286F6D02|nr:protein Star-like [Neocloeon triangulifer]
MLVKRNYKFFQVCLNSFMVLMIIVLLKVLFDSTEEQGKSALQNEPQKPGKIKEEMKARLKREEETEYDEEDAKPVVKPQSNKVVAKPKQPEPTKAPEKPVVVVTEPPAKPIEKITQEKPKEVATTSKPLSKREEEILRKQKVLNETGKSMEGLDQYDPKLVQFTRDAILISPEPATPNDTTSKLLTDMNKEPSAQQIATQIIHHLKKRKNGFIVECGAWDGVSLSNSIGLEIFYNWTSLLIEAAPSGLRNILKVRNRAWIAPACLSTKPVANMAQFQDNSYAGKIQGPAGNSTDKSMVNVLCIPFMTFMQALNRTSVDYFSLDVEGNEMDILPLIDFHKIKIDVMTIENQFQKGRLEKMLEIMHKNNFTLHTATHIDFIFINNRVTLP